MNQAEIRRRRRGHLSVVNTGRFSASREIADVAGLLAEQIAARQSPLLLRRPLLAYADAAHEFAGTVTGWAAERDARRRTEHLADDPGKRRYAITTLVDLAPRPALPEISDAMILDGSWAAALVEMAEPVDAALSDLLAQAFSARCARTAGSAEPVGKAGTPAARDRRPGRAVARTPPRRSRREADRRTDRQARPSRRTLRVGHRGLRTPIRQKGNDFR